MVAGGVDPAGNSGDTAWIRLSISADSGKDAAEDVELAILGVREVKPRDGYAPAAGDPPGVAGMSLPVTATPDRQARAHVPAGGFRMFDVAKVCRWHTPGATAKLELETSFRTFDARNQISWGETEIELAVTARNANAQRYRVRVAYDGSWGPGREDIWEHLRVTPPTRIAG